MKVGTAIDDIEGCEETDRTDEEFLKRFRYLNGPSSPAIHCYLEDIQREILFCISTCRGVSSSSKGSESRGQSAYSNAKQTMQKKIFATDLRLGSLWAWGRMHWLKRMTVSHLWLSSHETLCLKLKLDFLSESMRKGRYVGVVGKTI